MRKSGFKSTCAILLIGLGGCLDNYRPPITPELSDLLVVEGFIDATAHDATVNLFHTVALQSSDRPAPEPGASVIIFSSAGVPFALNETSPGVYTRTGFLTDVGDTYQLRIVTKAGGSYESDYVAVRETPDIDHLNVDIEGNRVEVSVDAHDPSNTTKFYHWDYLETWEYNSIYRSDFTFTSTRVVIPRKPGEGVYKCWRTVASTKIILGNTTRLTDDIVSKQLIRSLAAGSQELSIRYSILVRQRAITESEYRYQLQLQKSTENVGGLFDPQPSQVAGNMHQVNQAGTILGYFSASTVKLKRAFVNYEDLPENFQIPQGRGACVQDTICVSTPNPFPLNCSMDVKSIGDQEMITGSIFRDLGTIGFLKTTSECADCRVQGGTTVVPEFW